VRKALAVLAVATCAPAMTGCQANPCQGASVVVDDTDGGLLDLSGQTYWQSGPLDGPWIQYNGGETVTFKYPTRFRAAQPPLAWVSTGAYQGPDGGATLVSGAGQLNEVTSQLETSMSMTNQSCANYYVFVSVLGTLVDGGIDASPAASDASPSDATKD
jgi:hypothetical protein